MDTQQLREQLYGPMRDEGVFTWDRMYGEEYALADILDISPAFREEIAVATRKLAHIFSRVVPVLQKADDSLLLELGIPDQALEAVRLMTNQAPPTVVGRFDFAETDDGVKMLEFNSDTPTGIVEAFYVNGRACRFFSRKDPNEGMHRQFAPAFSQMMNVYRQLGYPTERIRFSSLDWHEEDRGTTLYLMRQSGLSSAQFAPLEALRVWKDRLYVQEGEDLKPVDVLYRLHALEKLAEEKAEDGYPTGEHFLHLVGEQKVAIINPPSAFLIQSKALQALMWSLHESGDFFTSEEHDTIASHMLPTYFENRFLGEADFVTKPIFGREGGGVMLYDSEGEVVDKDSETSYWEQPMIYQKRVRLPKITVKTLNGPYSGHLLWGSFVIGGEPSAIVARVGGPITNNMSYYLPVGVKK